MRDGAWLVDWLIKWYVTLRDRAWRPPEDHTGYLAPQFYPFVYNNKIIRYLQKEKSKNQDMYFFKWLLFVCPIIRLIERFREGL